MEEKEALAQGTDRPFAPLFQYCCVAQGDVIVAEYVKKVDKDEGGYQRQDALAKRQALARSYFQFILGAGTMIIENGNYSLICDQVTINGVNLNLVLISSKLYQKQLGESVIDFLKRKLKDHQKDIIRVMSRSPGPLRPGALKEVVDPIFNAMFDVGEHAFNNQTFFHLNAASESVEGTKAGVREIAMLTEQRLMTTKDLVREAKNMQAKAQAFKVKAKKLKWIGYWKWILTGIVVGVIVLSMVIAAIAVAVNHAKNQQKLKAQEAQLKQQQWQQQQWQAQAQAQQQQVAQRPIGQNKPIPTSRFRAPRPRRRYEYVWV